ncbi:MAG: DUF2313 domain-containing protein [Thermoanaerobacter sp.]|nr:DUF2313 domain-containing protein [Thermoanaerobacter sp.]
MGFVDVLRRFFPRRWFNTDNPTFISALGAQMDNLDADLDDLRQQLFIQTATWGIDRWEREVGVVPRPDDTLEARRARVLARLLALPSMREQDIKRVLGAMGYPDVSIRELWKEGIVTPRHNGIHDYSGLALHKGGLRWAEFKLDLGQVESELPLRAREAITATVEDMKPAHTALVAIIIQALYGDYLDCRDESGLSAVITALENYPRAGRHHDGRLKYAAAPGYGGTVAHDGLIAHGAPPPGLPAHDPAEDGNVFAVTLTHEDRQLVVSLLHDGTIRRRQTAARYGENPAALDGQSTVIHLAVHEEMPGAGEEMAGAAGLKIASIFPARRLCHGAPAVPAHDGGAYHDGGRRHRSAGLQPSHNGAALHNGTARYRYPGPLHDGAVIYGHGQALDEAAFRAAVTMNDRAQLRGLAHDGTVQRETGAFYGDNPAALDVFSSRLNSRLSFADPAQLADVQALNIALAKNDRFRQADHSFIESAHNGMDFHSGRITYRPSRYLRNGTMLYGQQIPPDVQTALARLHITDTVPGLTFYGYGSIRHDGGGKKWRHDGRSLRRPFITHDGEYLYNGHLPRRAAQASYGDLAAAHDGLQAYAGAQIHNGSIQRGAGLQDSLNITVRRRGRRIAA